MSVNQSRGDRNEPPHHRRPGRSANPNSPRNYSGGGGRGGGTAGPPSSGFYSGKSFKKVVSNAQGVQARVAGPNAGVGSGSLNSSTGGRGPQNGGHVQPPLRGTPDGSSTGVTVKQADVAVQRSTPGLPKAPQSNAVPPGSGAMGPSTPVKGPADASKAFSLQFGSISPGVINGMQVPARTSSAPPNLDEQKRAQAHRDSIKAVSKQHIPRKDSGPVDQPVEANHIAKEKKDMLSSPPGPVAAHAPKTSGPPMPNIPTGVSMQIPYHKSPIHLPFGGPNPPLQSQNIAGNTMPLPMHLPPMDFGPKGSAGVLPSNPQMSGGYRGLPQQQSRGFSNQDLRFDSYENKTLSVPLRPMGNDSITLGPQGGLARGMSARGHSSMHGIAGPNNGYGGSMMPERAGYSPRDELVSRHIPERFSPRPAYEPSNIQEHNNMNNVNQHGFPSPTEHTRVSTPPQSGSSDKPAFSEDRLHDMSVEAIKEFYSARDEKEVALCIKDLNAPGFYPSMISIWVTDSFERKDMDRDSLAKLLINLTKSQEGILTQDSLVRGFESVLSTLEDAVNDAPKAAEFLGRMFARILIENVIPYQQVSSLIYEGGEEQGQLVETGLAAEVLGVTLEIIKSEKGQPFLDDLCASSNIRLESFRSPTSTRESRLDKFILGHKE
ncbi:hypothetical protein M8C21_026935 [Ambrosia artemisiifolia]|uniref:MI domain-containing protein n=1 Tax=Ambrosia artemisiifolia TaxID=4212 RepID=A0AAD5BQ80_AMBAR|nr:hypothetical protein M8C21_026935 [Ambrosia artemisiifolia]